MSAGQLLTALDLDEEHVIVTGRQGMLVIGPQVMRYETILARYLSLLAREQFIR